MCVFMVCDVCLFAVSAMWCVCDGGQSCVFMSGVCTVKCVCGE